MNARLKSLTRVLDVRRFEEAARRQAVALALAAERAAEERERAGAAALARAQQAWRSAAARALDGAALCRNSEELVYRERVRAELSRAVADCRAARGRAELDAQEARKRTRSLEKLIERRVAEVDARLRRAEQKQFDEMAARRHRERVLAELLAEDVSEAP